MAIWKPDSCECVIFYEIINDEMTGDLIEPCQYHSNFQDALNTNRLKNESINTINELFDMTDKEVGFSFINGELSLTLYNFSPSEMEIVYALNLNVNIIEG